MIGNLFIFLLCIIGIYAICNPSIRKTYIKEAKKEYNELKKDLDK